MSGDEQKQSGIPYFALGNRFLTLRFGGLKRIQATNLQKRDGK